MKRDRQRPRLSPGFKAAPAGQNPSVRSPGREGGQRGHGARQRRVLPRGGQ